MSVSTITSYGREFASPRRAFLFGRCRATPSTNVNRVGQVDDRGCAGVEVIVARASQMASDAARGVRRGSGGGQEGVRWPAPLPVSCERRANNKPVR
eukprot:1175960-Prorocentrum_minimum.AAC.2